MNWNRIKAIIYKDVMSALGDKMVVMPLIIVPLVFCIILPVGLIMLSTYGLESLIQGAEQVKQITHLYKVPSPMADKGLEMVYIFLNYTFLPLFMLIPIMVSSILSANSVVGEKERQTLETLLYSPISNREFLTAKLLGSFIPGIIVGYIGFLLYFGISNILSYIMMGVTVVGAVVWWPAMLVLIPAVSLASLTLTLMVSIKAKTFVEAQQTAAILVLPLIILVITQITGVIVVNVWLIILFALILLLFAGIMLYVIMPRFTREEIVSRL